MIDQNRRVRGSPIITRRDETCQVLGGAKEKRGLVTSGLLREADKRM
jgi:hypothetical protein